MNRDHLIYDAKAGSAGPLRTGYRPPRQRVVRLPGPSGYANIRSSLQMMLQGTRSCRTTWWSAARWLAC